MNARMAGTLWRCSRAAISAHMSSKPFSAGASMPPFRRAGICARAVGGAPPGSPCTNLHLLP